MDLCLATVALIVLILLKKLLTRSVNPYRFPKVYNWAKQGKYFNFSGYPIFYYDSSARDDSATDKPALLLLHGYPTSSIDWLYMRDALEQRFHLIAPDYIGYGLSAKPVCFSYTIAAQADMIEQLLDSLRIKQVHVIAHDVGVSVAQELLARHVDQRRITVQSTVFLNGGLFPESHRPFITMKLLKIPVIGAILQFVIPRPLFGATFNRIFGPNTKRNAQELDETLDLLFFKAPYNLLQQLQCYINERAKNRERWVNALNRAQACQEHPVRLRLINGPFDPISGKHLVERYRQVVANPDTCMLDEHVGHYPNLEDPENTLKHFFDFHRSMSSGKSNA